MYKYFFFNALFKFYYEKAFSAVYGEKKHELKNNNNNALYTHHCKTNTHFTLFHNLKSRQRTYFIKINEHDLRYIRLL